MFSIATIIEVKDPSLLGPLNHNFILAAPLSCLIKKLHGIIHS